MVGRRIYLLLRALAFAGSLFWLWPAYGLNPAIAPAAYQHDVWDTRAGAPRDIHAIVQTADGWIWLATGSGLFRFDGVKFTLFEPPAGERLLGQHIVAPAPRDNGELWFGYEYGGLSVIRNGHVHHISAVPGKPLGSIGAIAFDGDVVWIASTSGLWRYRDRTLERADEAWGYPGKTARYVYTDRYRRVWAVDNQKLYLFDRVLRRFMPLLDVEGGSSVLESPDGRVWVAGGGLVRRLPAPVGGVPQRRTPTLNANALQRAFDRDGNYWAGGCPIGMCRRRASDIPAGMTVFPEEAGAQKLQQPWQMASLNVHAIMEDREGNLWVGTGAGLERFRDSRLVPVPLPPNSDWLSVSVDRLGSVWLASYTMENVSSLWRVIAGRAVLQKAGQQTYVVAPGRDGAVLIGGSRWIERRLGEQVLARYPVPPPAPGDPAHSPILLLSEDRDGLWLHLSRRGLFRWRSGAWESQAAHPQFAGIIYARTDAKGRPWFGTRSGEVIMLDGERLRRYTARDGVPTTAVTFIDVENELLISDDGGTSVWQNGRFRPLRAMQKNLLASVSGIVRSTDGDRWLTTPRGLFHVRAADWAAGMADPASALHGELWDEGHGFPGGADGSSSGATIRVANDRKLWVVGIKGVAWFDPAQVHRNAVPPVAQVNTMQAGGRYYPGGVAGVLAAGTARLQFDYTALSYTMPERLRFRYRLLGAEREWQNVGNARTASYTNLGPGHYRFEVSAINEDGVAGPVVTAPAFEIASRVKDTGWFTALLALLSGSVVYLLYLMRMRRLKRAWQLRMNERIAERERIARALHDTLLQGVQGTILRLDAVTPHLPPSGRARAELEYVLETSRLMLAEGRAQLSDLREAPVMSDLCASVQRSADMLATGHGPVISVQASGQAFVLAPDVHDEVSAIASEAMTNAVRHARAEHIDVLLSWKKRMLTLTIVDDGIGIRDDILLNGRPGHWGLTGMRERAANVKASLAIRNRPGGRGAEVVLTLQRIRHGASLP
jgi:signal transduction histidine kinase/ligand-binding sensor domain-containing protein